jgi:hypothetical protein
VVGIAVTAQAYTAQANEPAPARHLGIYGPGSSPKGAFAMSNTSIGRGPASGGNENHDGDPLHKTLGEVVGQEPPAGNEVLEGAAPDMPAGVAGGAARPDIKKGPESYPDGPNVESSPWELDAARGEVPKE